MIDVGSKVCLLTEKDYSDNGFFKNSLAVVGKVMDIAPNGKYIVQFKSLSRGNKPGKVMYLNDNELVRVGELINKRLRFLLDDYGTMLVRRIITEMEEK